MSKIWYSLSKYNIREQKLKFIIEICYSCDEQNWIFMDKIYYSWAKFDVDKVDSRGTFVVAPTNGTGLWK